MSTKPQPFPSVYKPKYIPKYRWLIVGASEEHVSLAKELLKDFDPAVEFIYVTSQISNEELNKMELTGAYMVTDVPQAEDLPMLSRNIMPRLNRYPSHLSRQEGDLVRESMGETLNYIFHDPQED